MGDDKERNAVSANETEGKLAERKNEATSDETVSDLEESEKGLATPADKQNPAPSPDGAFDEVEESNDGPM